MRINITPRTAEDRQKKGCYEIPGRNSSNFDLLSTPSMKVYGRGRQIICNIPAAIPAPGIYGGLAAPTPLLHASGNCMIPCSTVPGRRHQVSKSKGADTQCFVTAPSLFSVLQFRSFRTAAASLRLTVCCVRFTRSLIVTFPAANSSGPAMTSAFIPILLAYLICLSSFTASG